MFLHPYYKSNTATYKTKFTKQHKERTKKLIRTDGKLRAKPINLKKKKCFEIVYQANPTYTYTKLAHNNKMERKNGEEEDEEKR